MTGLRTSDVPPDHLRCRKNDGKQWRCYKESLPNLTLCSYHYDRQRRNYANRLNPPLPSSPKTPASDPPAKKRRKKSKPAPEPDLDAEETRELPNGVMTISQAPARVRDNAGPVLDRKVGGDEPVFWSRSVRSKNVEPVPVGPVKRLNVGGKKLAKKKKRSCHKCGDKKVTKADRCRKCKKIYFCSSCLSDWYQQMSELEARSACPVCCGFCNCEKCTLSGVKDRSNREAHDAEDVIDEIKQLDFPDLGQLSSCKQITQYDMDELEIEAVEQGLRSSCIQFQVAEQAIINCNYCKILLGGFHRSCSKCFYKLCLNCAWKFRNRLLPELVENGKSSKAAKACKNHGKENGAEKMPSTGSDYSSPTSFESKDISSRSSIACPTSRLGGCSDGILRVVFMLPFGRSNELDNHDEGYV